MKFQVMTTAWKMIKDKLFTNLSDALKAAWAKVKLTVKLKLGAVDFIFEKLDGSIRKAKGTLNSEMFEYETKNQKTMKSELILTYFDLDVREFRCFYITKLKSVL